MAVQAAPITAAPPDGNGIPLEEQIDIPRGLLGFESHRRYRLQCDPDLEPFARLESVDDTGPSFIVVDPRLFFPHYRVEVDAREIGELGVVDLRRAQIWVIVTVPDDLSRMSANLQGPLVVNRENNRGKQLVLVRSPYTTCHYLLDELQKLATRHAAEAEIAAC